MFLKYIAILFATFAGCLTAQAQESTVLAAGTYNLVSGEQNLCPNFTVSEKEASGKSLTIGSLYSFETMNSNYNLESDLDPNCRFIEQSKREDRGNETQLTRINDEVCNKQLRSRTISIAVIQRDRIEIRHEIQGAEPYTCIWNK